MATVSATLSSMQRAAAAARSQGKDNNRYWKLAQDTGHRTRTQETDEKGGRKSEQSTSPKGKPNATSWSQCIGVTHLVCPSIWPEGYKKANAKRNKTKQPKTFQFSWRLPDQIIKINYGQVSKLAKWKRCNELKCMSQWRKRTWVKAKRKTPIDAYTIEK